MDRFRNRPVLNGSTRGAVLAGDPPFVPSLAGSKIDKYQIVEEVGHGGMAVVYRGRDTVLEREVAVKVLHAHLADREESRARLQREALAVAKLRHDNILEIFDYSGGKDQESYIVTEFIHGPTMRQWVDEKLDPRPTVAAMVVHRLCLALSEAHRSGIVHRDIKPENVMVRQDDGVLKLMDFGIAQILDDQKLTLTGQLIGSPAYMAPELISGRPLDQRTDLFSLGILLYQLATGTLPFSGRNPHEVLNRIADGDYPPPSTLCPLVDRDLEAIIAVALATSPDERYQSAETFARELEGYLAEMGVPPTPQELKAYFTEPEGYVRELDERVATALMQRATHASEQGHTARAVALLGRVLELDAEHAGARALLDKVRRRERRLRQVLMGAGALALTGLVAAGVMLVPRGPMSGQLVAAASDPPGGSAASKTARPRGNRDRGAPADVEPSSSEPPNPGPRSTDPTEPVAPRPTPPDDLVDPPDAAPPAGRPHRKARRANPDDDDGDGQAAPFSCRIDLENIPFSTARNHKLQVGGDETLNIDSRTMQLELDGTTTVSLTGGTWRGTARPTAESCAQGPVKLRATPRPARVRISGVPPNTVVRCMKGCAAKDIGTNQEADKELNPIPLDSDHQDITLALQCPGHEPKTIKHTVYSGSQPLKTSLDPRK